MIERKILANVTNQVDGTYVVGFDGNPFTPDMYNEQAFHFILNDGSGSVIAKFFGTLESDPATSSYEDITVDTWGLASITTATKNILVDNAKRLSMYKWLYIEVTCNTGGADDSDYKIDWAAKTNSNVF